MSATDGMTIKEIKDVFQRADELCQFFANSGIFEKSQAAQSTTDDSHWEIGKAYFIRTVTHHLVGKLTKVTQQELVLLDATWVADDGRFSEALKSGTVSEQEPFPDGASVIVGRGSVIDAVVWPHALLRSVK